MIFKKWQWTIIGNFMPVSLETWMKSIVAKQNITFQNILKVYTGLKI